MMEHHPYAKLFPVLDDDQTELLADDIRQNGLRQPILIDQHERIIDGRNRSIACLLAGVDPVYEVFTGNDAEILNLVVSLNIHRRHLNESQRAMIAATLANMPKHVTAAKKRASHDASIEASCPAVDQGEAAALMKVSRSSVQRAATVANEGIEELKADVAAGSVSVSKAAQVAKLDPKQQKKAVESKYKEPTAVVPSKSIGLLMARRAITTLKRIPADDDERKAGFDLVADWLVDVM